MGFTRRTDAFPSQGYINQIEGVIIVDQPQPGAIQGAGEGVACCIGEFADCTYAVQVASTVGASGNISTLPQPVQIFSGADLISKLGGFDETIGEFGGSLGNGFVELRNKQFTELVVIPVNLASANGARYFRDLPVSYSQSNTTPVVPMQAASLVAGTEFRVGAGRIRVAKTVNFTALAAIATGLGGSIETGSAAVTQPFNSGDAAAKVWQVEAVGPVFTDETAGFNDPTAANFVPFPADVGGHDSIGDYVAIGYGSKFSRLQLNNTGGTAGVGGVVAWEYWNGTTWAALSNVVDGTANFNHAVGNNQVVTFTSPADWAQTTLSGTAAFYVRARVTTAHSTNPVYDQGFIAGTAWSTITRPDGSTGAAVGDILVIGNNNAGAFQPLPAGGNLGAGTYRVQSTPVAGSSTIVVERLDGASFNFVTAGNVPWRLHYGSDADSAPVIVPGNAVPGGYAAADANGYTTPTRPLTDPTGAATDGDYAAGTVLSPASAPPTPSGSSWSPLANLAGRVMPGGSGGLHFQAAVQRINAPQSASLDALYNTAIAALLSEDVPAHDVNIPWAARKSTLNRNALYQTVIQASQIGVGHMAVLAPDLGVNTMLEAISSSDPGVGAIRNERVVYSWPGCVTFIPEAVNFRVKTADGNTTIDGNLDLGMDGFVASLMSVLQPELDIGQTAPPVPGLLAPVLGYQRGLNGSLGIGEYTQLKASGIAALKMDRTAGPIIQSGITTSLTSGQTDINRRRFADFIEDSVAAALQPFVKLPITEQFKASVDTEVVAFLNNLLSPDNPPAQRIVAYSFDNTAGNGTDANANGYYVITASVQMTPIAKSIIFVANVGPNVTVAATV